MPRTFPGLVARWGIYTATAGLLAVWCVSLFREIVYHDVILSRWVVRASVRQGAMDATLTSGPPSEIWLNSTTLSERTSTSGIQLHRFWSNHGVREKLGLILPALNPYAVPITTLPVQETRVILPLWVLFGPLFILASVLMFREIRIARNGCCIFCGYDLRENTSGKCPECGRSVIRGFRRLLRPFMLGREFLVVSPRDWAFRLGIVAVLVMVSNVAWYYLMQDSYYVWNCTNCKLRIETITASKMKRVLNDSWRICHDHQWEAQRPWMRGWMFWAWAKLATDQPPSLEEILKSDPQEFKLGQGGQLAAQRDSGPIGDLMRKTYPMFELRKPVRRPG